MYVTYYLTEPANKAKIRKGSPHQLFTLPLLVLFFDPLHRMGSFEKLAQIKGEESNEENIKSLIGI